MLKIIIKFAASGLMILSGYFFGKSLEENMRLRYETLNKLSEAVYFLKSKICGENYNLPEALIETDKKYFDNRNSVFYITADEIEKSDASLENIWIRATDKCAERTFLRDEDADILKKAGSLLGLGDVQVQQDNLQDLILSLNRITETAFNRMKKDGALYIKIGLAVGSIIAILMW